MVVIGHYRIMILGVKDRKNIYIMVINLILVLN